MKVNYAGQNVILPDFLVVGAAKSATTSLYYYLKKNPEIFLPKIKETSFFALKCLDYEFKSPPVLETVRKEKEYFNLYSNSSQNKICGDISPAYLYRYRESVNEIKRIYGENYSDIKIVILLRNPIERIFSQYMMFRRDNLEPLSLFEAIDSDVISTRISDKWNIFYDYVGFSKYSSQVEYYQKHFKDVKILLYEDISRNTEKSVNEITDFLGVSKTIADFSKNYNKSGAPKIVWIHDFLQRPTLVSKILKQFFSEERRLKIRHFILSKNLKSNHLSKDEYRKIQNLLEADIKRTSQLIERDLSSWLK